MLVIGLSMAARGKRTHSRSLLCYRWSRTTIPLKKQVSGLKRDLGNARTTIRYWEGMLCEMVSKCWTRRSSWSRSMKGPEILKVWCQRKQKCLWFRLLSGLWNS